MQWLNALHIGRREEGGVRSAPTSLSLQLISLSVMNVERTKRVEHGPREPFSRKSMARATISVW
jgi:hypothetical protein